MKKKITKFERNFLGIVLVDEMLRRQRKKQRSLLDHAIAQKRSATGPEMGATTFGIMTFSRVTPSITNKLCSVLLRYHCSEPRYALWS
jgi:hypothetical protein